jgi:hypothetical protein
MPKNGYEDKRNWKLYNEQLVKRGEFYLNPRFLTTWNDEIKQMNVGKVGQPYLYPDSMVEFTAYFHCKGFDYRGCEGILRGLSQAIAIPFPVISYCQICRRVNTLEVNFESVEENLIVAIDGTGEKVSNRGDWIRHKWRVRRGWITVVIMGTPDGRIIDIRVGPETLNERRAARGMLRKNNKKVKKAILDGHHDCKPTFNLCEQYNIEIAIKIRKDASTRARGSARRKREVCEYKRLGHKRWAKEKSYGLRWPASEGIFSANKRMFGEAVRATNKQNMYHEVRLKFWVYNKLKDVG